MVSNQCAATRASGNHASGDQSTIVLNEMIMAVFSPSSHVLSAVGSCLVAVA